MMSMFDSKAAQIRCLAADGYSAKEIAAQVGCSLKYVYVARGRDSSGRTINGRLDQLFREVCELRVGFSDFRDELRERLGMPTIIDRRLEQII
jgi:hypothetical protein